MSSEQSTQTASGTMIDIRKLSVINQLGQVGTDGVSESLKMLGSDGGTMEVTKIDFLDIVDRHAELSDEKHVGIRVRMKDAPGGHLLVLFTRENAHKITKLMLSDVTSDMGSVEPAMAQSAAEELGNMMASGFIDGWADAFGRTIDHQAPKLVYSPASDIIKATASMGNNPFALVFDAEIRTAETTINTKIYLFPDMEAFVAMLNAIGNS